MRYAGIVQHMECLDSLVVYSLAPYEIVYILITVYAYLNAVHLIEEAYELGYEYAIGAHPDG
jgi:hypothetical protein